MTVFADRTHWDLAANQLTAVSARLKEAGVQTYDLTVSNPTRCGFEYFPEKLFAPFSDPINLKYDPDPRGLARARQAVAQYYHGQGIDIPLDQIFLTASTSEAYGFLFRLLANPHDHVVFPKPSYPLFEFLSGIHDLDWKTYSLVYDTRWRVDRKSFEMALADGPKAVILVNPNNPTGSCLDKDEMDMILSVSAHHGIPVICDEVFLDYCYPGSSARSLAGNPNGLTFVLGGLSKALALPQMKCSWIIINGPSDVVHQAISRLEIIADTYLSVNTPVQNALADWMAMRHDIQQQILSRVLQNKKILEHEIQKLGKKAEVLNADGGWSAVVRSQVFADEESFVVRLLEEDHVFVHPGYFFDFDASGYLVLSLLPQEDVFQQGIQRLVKRIG